MLERRLEKQLLICLFDGEHLRPLSKQILCGHHVEVQIVDDAVGSHRVVAKAQGGL